MIKIRWVNRITNEEVLNRVHEGKSIWIMIKNRRDPMIGTFFRTGRVL